LGKSVHSDFRGNPELGERSEHVAVSAGDHRTAPVRQAAAVTHPDTRRNPVGVRLRSASHHLLDRQADPQPLGGPPPPDPQPCANCLSESVCGQARGGYQRTVTEQSEERYDRP
jgi:hypothetical protein